MKYYFKGVQIARHSFIIVKISRNIVEVPKGASVKIVKNLVSWAFDSQGV